MELNREQKRLLMLHEYRVGTNATETVRQINEAWGEGTVGKTPVYDHFKEFKAEMRVCLTSHDRDVHKKSTAKQQLQGQLRDLHVARSVAERYRLRRRLL
ncbi:hypothetical protein KIN20_010595 [Parelaphostrongylus tenuis]|uniref:Mos1 transposase HTH domain-containing protein n=1 Tax=Parelaphostrongylus tenuis TaxID=148309 RepID=A0AAD5MZ75_PARTN|nr:hypothetical protein KIN20_010595 [Parelaphostrongylus tenuis]